MTERRKFFYDEDGNLRGYWPVWHDWPRGEQGHNVDYDGEHEPECPICGMPLHMTEYVTAKVMERILTVYVCEECQTQYTGPVREQPVALIQEAALPYAEPQQTRNTVSTQTATASIEEKYRYLIG